MSIWALSDLHLAFSVPEKTMEAFGDPWCHYTEKIKQYWLKNIKAEDLVLIPGDISWAMHPEQAKIDLDWIDRLPGTKVILRGNHDYWWSSLNKVKKILPPSIHLIQNNVFRWNDFQIAGTRLWDTTEYQFNQYVQYKDNSRAKVLLEHHDDQEAEKIFLRELIRLELSLKNLTEEPGIRIAMTHYPPIGAHLESSRASQLLEKYRISYCVFGHLHSLKQDMPLFGEKNGIRYVLTSCDYLNFMPYKLY